MDEGGEGGREGWMREGREGWMREGREGWMREGGVDEGGEGGGGVEVEHDKCVTSDLTMQNSLKVSLMVPHVIQLSSITIYGRMVFIHRGYRTSSSPSPDSPRRSHHSRHAHKQSSN